MINRVILMVGIPGSGKSTASSSYLQAESTVKVSADDFFMVDGQYVFDRTKLHKAHTSCQRKFMEALEAGVRTVVVDNTNTTAKERSFYVEAAAEYGYEVFIHSIAGDPVVCAARNVHGVPLEACQRMADRIDMEPGFYKL